MTSQRPTHAEQQQDVDDAMAALPSSRWRWLFTPDPRWLKAVDTTTLREVNAVRMFVGITLLFAVTYFGVIVFALTRCGVHIRLFGLQILQILPPPGRLNVKDWLLCEEATTGGRLLNFASGEFGTYGLILAGMASIALGAKWVNRGTDTEHQERVLLAKAEVEKAKKAPIILPVPTAEHAAIPVPVQQTVNVNPEGPDAGAVRREPPTGDARVDDERGEP